MNTQVEKLLGKPVNEITEKDYNLYLKFKREGLISSNPYTDDVVQKIKEQNMPQNTITYNVVKRDVIDNILEKCVDKRLLKSFLHELKDVEYLLTVYLQLSLEISYHNAIKIMDYLMQNNIVDTKENKHKVLNRKQLEQVFEIGNLKNI